jgi:WD40 repeat protein
MTADPTKLQKTKEFSLPSIAMCVARMPNSGRLIFGSSDFKLHELDVFAEKPQPVPFGEGHQSYVTGVVLTAPNVAVSGSYDGQLFWWDVEKREATRKQKAHELWIRRLAISPDGKTIASVADDMQCKLWNAESGELLRQFSDHKPITPHDFPSMLHAVTFSSDGKFLATGDKIGHVAIWEAASGSKIATLEAPVMYTWDPRQRRHSIGGIRSLAFSPDNRLLAVGGIGQIGNIDHLDAPARIEIFDWQTGERKHELNNDKFKGLVEHLQFAPDGSWLLSSGGAGDGFVTFTNVETGKTIHQDKLPMHVHQLALNEAFDTLFAVGHHKIAVCEFKAAEPTAATAEPSKS